jgi:hypothetical protein
MAGRKIAYRTATHERALPVPRVAAWAAVTAAAAERSGGVDLGAGAGRVTEVVLSDEPPWRRVVRLDGDHTSPLCQTSITIRDDGDSCLIAWSCLVDPTGVDADALDDLVSSVSTDGSRQLDLLADAVAVITEDLQAGIDALDEFADETISKVKG